MTERNTCYIERSKVREILIGHNAATQAILPKIDALPIFTPDDFHTQPQTPLDHQILSECRDFLADLIGGAKFEGRAIEHAKDLIEQAAAELSRPTSQPWTLPLGWLHQIEEPSGETSKLYSSSPDNPWIHWLEKYKSQCTYTATPLYAAPHPQCSEGTADPNNSSHYLSAIRLRLEQLYDASADNPRLREHLSDEVDWVDEQIGALSRPPQGCDK